MGILNKANLEGLLRGTNWIKMSKQYRSVFADENILKQHNCQKIRNSEVSAANPDTLILNNGWQFSTFHSTIPNDEENQLLLRSLKQTLFNNYDSVRSAVGADGLNEWLSEDHLTVNSFKLKMIPMIFSNDVMRFSYTSSDSAVEFRSYDALLCWISQHVSENIAKFPLNVLQVPYASSWNARHLQNLNVGTTREDVKNAEAVDFAKSGNPCDWTLSSDYCCTVKRGEAQRVLSARLLTELMSGSDHFLGLVEPRQQSGIDFEMLKDRNAPILFYDEFILYQDDLDDSGEVVFEVKLRVMPSCWFVVSKFYLRVDGVQSRCRETRLFVKFDEPEVVHMELTWREGPHFMESAHAQQSGPGAASARLPRNNNQELRNSTHTIPLSEGEIHRYYCLRL